MKIKNLVMILTLGAATMSCASSAKVETKTNYADLTKQYAKVQLIQTSLICQTMRNKC